MATSIKARSLEADPEQVIQGIRVVAESSGSGLAGSSTVSLFAGDRSRVESGGGNAAAYTIERRDLKKRITVFPQRREYRELPLFNLIPEEEKARFLKSGEHWRRRHVPAEQPPRSGFRIKTVYEETGETSLMFGCTAHRWRIVRRDEREHAHGSDWSETTTDAWYLDSEELTARYSGFSSKLIHRVMVYVTVNHERPVIEEEGQRPSGLCALSESRTVRRHVIVKRETLEMEETQSHRIISLTEELFAAGLFEVPSGYREMRIYPSRLSMARADFKRGLQRLRFAVAGRYRRVSA
jgi:hypothetical protein